jgi:hypothetical protein
MDTSELEAAYRAVLDLATVAAGSPVDPPAGGDQEAGGDREGDEEWGPGDVLAHLIVNDRLLNRAVRSILAGAPEPYDNVDAVELAELRAQGTALGGVTGLAGELEASSRELTDLAARLDEAQAATPLPARILDGDNLRLDRPTPISALLAIQARAHLPMHLRQLSELMGPP